VELDCSDNELRLLPIFNKNLTILRCSNNKLKFIQEFNENLEELYCSSNQLTFLPKLNKKIRNLYCSSNKLTILPAFNVNLQEIYCINNKLELLPQLNENLRILDYEKNPVYDIFDSNTLEIIKEKIEIINKFRYLYYILKFKKQFRIWLWKRVREPKIIKKYHPKYLLENLSEEIELDENKFDEFLEKWINE
jgi:Leucine-rich repeat (LRR) protein